MDINTFYSILSGTCFTLVGLWWAVLQYRSDLLQDEVTRHLAGGVYASFLIPGVMGLMAQIGGETSRGFWRLVFVVAALFGMTFTLRLMQRLRANSRQRFFRNNLWIVTLVYALVLVFGLAPELGAWAGLQGLQVEAILLSLLILLAHGLTWELLTEPKP